MVRRRFCRPSQKEYPLIASIILAAAVLLAPAADDPQILELNPCIKVEAGARLEGLPASTPLLDIERRVNGDRWVCVAGGVPSFAGPVTYVDAGGVETDLLVVHVNEDGWDDLGEFLEGQPGAEETATWLGVELASTPDTDEDDPDAQDAHTPTSVLPGPDPAPWILGGVLAGATITAAITWLTQRRRRGSVEAP